MRKRKLQVLLGGNGGNAGISYDGLELLPELFREGRWLRLWSEASALVASRRLRWRSILATTFGPWCSPVIWRVALAIVGKKARTLGDYVAINPQRLCELDLQERARACRHDLAMRPFKDSFALRLRLVNVEDPGNYQKGNLASLQADSRYPLADIRLLEFCFAIPAEQFLHNGRLRAIAHSVLANRLPKQVLEETRAGLTGADWHEDLSAARSDIVDELNRIEACPVTAGTLDLPRLRQLTEEWPANGWEQADVHIKYRYALLSAIAVGYFLRRATGSNA